jgi:hypothetical protein
LGGDNGGDEAVGGRHINETLLWASRSCFGNMRHISVLLAAGFGLLFDYAIAQSLPSNPTSIFLSPINPNLAYVFLPSTSSPSQIELASLNISTTIQSSNITLETLTSDLPFLEGRNAGKQTAYIPSISSSGSLGVYAGQCTNSSSFWIFTPASDPASQSLGVGTWREMSTALATSVSTNALHNANFLASSFSFSTLVNSNDTQRTVYAFGGMCPTTMASNSSTWQSSATYSNSMLKLSYKSPTSYDLSVSASAGNSPIPEAGFTFTALTATSSNSTGIETQAQNFVLLGGHTGSAFINMSQVALFSLPQESWSFQNIDSASSKGSTELAVKSTSATMVTPDSRSGHTAVLSADGSSVVVFGGWVGDVRTAAQPQLAVLRTGSGFGGTGNWAWELPGSTGTGLSAGEGIYGHGAVMLPGNVMMVLGGNRIPVPSSSRLSKRSDAATGALFLNTTSMTWSSGYTNPSYTASATSSPGSSSTSSSGSDANKVGLGAGLGLGLAAVIGALCVYFWYARRLKRRRQEAREKDLNELSRSAADYYASHGVHASMAERQRDGWWSTYQSGEMSQREGLIPLPASTSNLGNRSMGIGPGGGHRPGPNTPNGSYGGYDDDIMRSMFPRSNSNRGGASIPRKPVSSRTARGYYQPAPSSSSNQSYSGFDFGTTHSRANSLGTAGVIHPIYEADEDLDAPDAQNRQPDVNGDTEVGPAIGSLETDPFVDPQPTIHIQPPRSNPGSPPGTSYGDRNTPTPESSAREREREIKKWVADWAAADAILNSRAQSITYSGRISPSKESGSGRTESNLSERSVATISALGLSRNGSTRNNSLTAFFSNGPSSWNPFITFGTTSAGLGSITEHHVRGDGNISPVSDHASVHGHIRNGEGPNPPPSSGSATSSSFTTAQTSQSFAALRNEGESLLPRPHHDDMSEPSSPSKRKAAAFSLRRRDIEGGWLGSLKRVFRTSGAEDESGSFGSASARSSPTRGYRSESLSNSPTRPDYGVVMGGDAAPPRRTVSATATMWRRKQGKDGWQDSEEAEDERRANTLTLDGSWRSRLARGETLQQHQDHDGNEGGEEEDEEEWDIERAVERRVVQVMFTVPKEKLRVVNPGEEEASEASSSRRASEDEKAQGLEPGDALEVLVPIEQETERQKEKGLEHEQEQERVGRGLEVKEVERRTPSSSSASSKGKGRVQEIVEKLEAWKD